MIKVVISEVDGYLKEITEGLDFSSIEQFFQDHMRGEVSFEELVYTVATEGLEGLDAEKICTFAFDTVFYELSMARPMFLKMLLFSVLFSLAHRFLATKNKYISDIGFLMIYATLMVLLMQSFFMVRDIALEGINTLMTFLSALIPTYALTMVFSGHVVSGAMLYEVAFLLIYLVETLMKVFLSPIIHIFVLVLFLNHLFEEDKLSKLAQFMEKGIQVVLKTTFGTVIGLGVVQSMLTPAKDKLTGNTLLSGLSAIPGIGNVVNSAGEILLSCGMLIKNSVGVVALIAIVIITIIPVLQIGVFCVMYHLLSILLQPIADVRITECVSGVARGCGLYLKIVIYSMMLFFILFSIISMATSFVR